MAKLEANWIALYLSSHYRLCDTITIELGDRNIMDSWIHREEALVRAYPRGRVLHVLPGNVPSSSVVSVLRALITKNVSVVKPASDDPLTPMMLALSFLDANPRHPVAKALNVAYWESEEDTQAVRSLLDDADAACVWGGHQAIAWAQHAFPPSTEVVKFGPKRSLALLGKGCDFDEAARRIAHNCCMYDQRKQGRVSPWDDAADPVDAQLTDSLQDAQPGLFACYQAAAAGIGVSGERAGKPLMRLVVSAGALDEQSASDPDAPVATAFGVNLYAKQLVDGRDRPQLERLCRYVMRPPLSQERLEWRNDGWLLLTLKNVWKDGTHAITLEPHDLLVRLCAAIPPPWFNMTRYFGVLSSHSKHRSRVVPHDADPERLTRKPASGDQLELAFDGGNDEAPVGPGRSLWGWLLRHVFRADVMRRPHGVGARRQGSTRHSQVTGQTPPLIPKLPSPVRGPFAGAP